MKPAGLYLLLFAGLSVAAATEVASTGLASPETMARIREGLPAYQPPTSMNDGPPDNVADTDPLPAADVLILPKMTVKELRLPPNAADHLMSKRDFNRKMANLYDDTVAESGLLNIVLNSLTIPFLSPSKAARGRAIYRAREIERLQHVNEISKAIDPAAAAKFTQEMDNSYTTKPAGK